ncbi:Gfo/Idh/MocA family protein [Pseudomonas matsuisoli]|uniref:Glucose-fructose oxidoreductase n=1 Tax=Pseudomonas matsuisoli TaxID=1515666 RepID=A0A917PNA6_9PSED|nr:Gfo/Idh/MocA family oxidoreductase [Pseudomonas matsuisoli]GGJ85526.1 glucose-fructose oxidoreductase [Pseudomonas matsuisoli]
MSKINTFFPGRRRFMAQAGTTAVAAGMLGAARSATAQAAPTKASSSQPAADLPQPVTLPHMQEGKTDKTKMPVQLGPDQRVGIAVVGIGRLTLEEILPAMAQSQRCKVTALVSGDGDKARRVAAMYGVPEDSLYSYETFDSIRDNPNVHAVYIVLPNSMHHEFTLRAASAGKHVLCEKPMANSVKECQEMITACADAQRLLMIAYRIQYEPMNRQVMQWVRGGKEVGQIKLLEMANCQNQSTQNTDQWRHKKALAGGGALPDIGLYCLNTARYLLGEEPVEVFGTIHTNDSDPRFTEVEETILWHMRFPSGVLAQCMSSYSTFNSKRYRILGDKGYLEMDPAFAYKGLKLKRSKLAEGTDAVLAPGIEQIAATEKNQFALEMDHFAECVVKNQRPFTPGEEGLQDQRIMEAIYESARISRPVKLSSIEEKDAFRGTPPSNAEST